MGSSTAQYGLTGRWVRSRQITFADTASTVAIIDVPAGTLIPPKGVVCVVTTLFAGGSPLIDIGDGDNTDGWIDQGDITATSTGTYSGDETTTAAYADNGRYYSTADTIDAVVSASLTAGEAYVFAYLINVSDVVDD
jgi:hypothetical protein